ncbi:BMC domain-containing protein [Lysinibacillus sp. FSL K6-0232]|uniref:BMC domain-containing protein n=1 Tax=unclassified Lysinibacillus TaxID=2636778 RepID=UPI0030F6ED7E
MKEAIGMIETFGMIGSIEAADAMLKAADVQLVRHELVDGGIVTIIVAGDVGAVQAAVEAGKATAERIGKVLGAHVIPRAADDIHSIILEQKPAAKPATKASKPAVRKAQSKDATDSAADQ